MEGVANDSPLTNDWMKLRPLRAHPLSLGVKRHANRHANRLVTTLVETTPSSMGGGPADSPDAGRP
jgi:hypothetical protein